MNLLGENFPHIELKVIDSMGDEQKINLVEIAKTQEPQLYRTGTMGPEDKILCGDENKWIDPKDDK